jgi:diguanylate cyclase (GGDEF)-like protein
VPDILAVGKDSEYSQGRSRAMRNRPDAREIAHATIPIVVALVVLSTSALWQPRVSEEVPAGMTELVVLILLSAVATLYQPIGRQTLGLGALALPPILWFYGLWWAGSAAPLIYILGGVGRRLLLHIALPGKGSIRILPTLTDAARLSLATLTGGSVWLLSPGVRLEGAVGPTSVAWGLIALAAYVGTLVLLHWIELGGIGASFERLPGEVLRSSVLDLFGWCLGITLVGVVAATGWLTALVLSSGIAVLAAEAARNVYLRRRAVARATELWEVTKAGHRIIFRGPDLGSIAGHVLEECLKMLPFHWFQFELLSGEEAGTSWCAGPDKLLREGVPEPADSPPALPGVHRRTSWKILQRQLRGDDEPIAMMRFWCDPRQLEPASIELLDSLQPQIAAAVHRALLDRRAKQDPLTGLADRRVLEAHLEEVFARTSAEGGSMAVIMCDIDRFKKINDNHGHDVGDQALKRVVEILEEHRRESDLCSRYGGEEFSLVLEKTDGRRALEIAERLRRAVEDCVFAPGESAIPLRLSAGVAAFPELQVKQGKDLLVLADEAMIQAKKRGRNRSLLNLGRRRYWTPRGKILEEGEVPVDPFDPPRLFT